jgi:hypothetical protein
VIALWPVELQFRPKGNPPRLEAAPSADHPLKPPLQWRAANTTIVLIAISLTLMAFL